jgi:hypothetical protein
MSGSPVANPKSGLDYSLFITKCCRVHPKMSSPTLGYAFPRLKATGIEYCAGEVTCTYEAESKRRL